MPNYIDCKRYLILIAFVCIGSSLGIPHSWADLLPVSVGYAEEDITPPLGVTMPGYFHIRHATGVLDPLQAKVLILSQGDCTLVFAALDLIGIDTPINLEIRKEIQRQTGISSDHIFLHGTHTHTGATVSEIQDRLPGQVTSAVQKALTHRVQETSVTLGTGQEKSISFIRRFLMKDGSIRTNPGSGNPDIVRPIGKIDPTVYTLTFHSAKTILVSFGLHPDCIGGEKFSADYPYHLTQAVKKALGEDWNVLYLNACCGNVNHINVNDVNQLGGYEGSRKIGQSLAQTALAAHKNGKPIVVDSLMAKTALVSTPVRQVPQEMVDWAKQQMTANAEEAQTRLFNEETPSEILKQAEIPEKFQSLEIIALRIGPVGIVGLPAEVFKEVADDIKTHSLLDPTLVIGLTGGDWGYLPHPRGYDEGGYEATFGSAHFAPETSILWSNAATTLLKESRVGTP